MRASTARLAVAFAICAALCVGLLPTAPASAATGPAPAIAGPSGPALTADLSQFRPGNIISDAVFYNSGTMSEGQIQAFLDSKVRSCAAGNTCLKDYYDTSRAIEANAMCGAYQGGGRERASTIIFRVAQACGLNPQVILVMLEKEQSLITHTNPSATRYRIAMGQGCPDTAACDTRYYGFFNQVMGAAWQLKRYGNPPGTSQYFTWYPVGRVSNVLYNPNAACGSSPVLIENKATAALYYYTPYQPNAAALRAGYGLGDGCSAYGNRNFYQFFNDWFGASSVAANSPFGNVELVAASPGEYRVVGWAADPNSTESLAIHVYVGPVGSAHLAAVERGDVGAAYPALGSKHGFDVKIPATGSGSVNVCVYAMNVGAGANVLLRCQLTDAMSGAPQGKLESVRGVDGGVQVTGWALDPDLVGPTSVHVYVGNAGTALNAGVARSDLVSVAYPSVYGVNHGFDAKLAAAPGVYTVCVYAINSGPGTTTALGCQTITVPGAAELGRAPVGALESVVVVGARAEVTGWALDLDTTAAIKVHLYVGAAGSEITANRPRSDIGAQYPGFGPDHGFFDSVALPVGVSSVCAYAINNAAGGNTLLGCKNVTVAAPTADLGRMPFGNYEGVTLAGNIAVVSGWAIDPDTAAPIKVHVYVGGAGFEYTADKARSDVGSLYPSSGANHGFSETITLPTGTSTICVYAINNAAGGHPLLGCRVVNVVPTSPDLGRAPFGNLESVTAVTGAVDVVGWAIDPDTSAPIKTHVYVGPAGAEYTADKSRSDVARAYPAFGDRHGISERVAVAAGVHRICVYAINSGVGGHTLMGCRDVTVP